MEQIIIEISKQYGPLVAVVAGLVYYLIKKDQARDQRDVEREAKLGGRIGQLEDYIKGELMGMQREMIQAINSQAESNREVAESNRALRDALAQVPCLSVSGERKVPSQC